MEHMIDVGSNYITTQFPGFAPVCTRPRQSYSSQSSRMYLNPYEDYRNSSRTIKLGIFVPPNFCNHTQSRPWQNCFFSVIQYSSSFRIVIQAYLAEEALEYRDIALQNLFTIYIPLPHRIVNFSWKGIFNTI
jgi:hypothetical protein